MAPPPSPSPSSPTTGAGGSTPNAPSSSLTSTTPKPSPATSQTTSSVTDTNTNANTTSPLQLYIAIRRGRVVLLTTVTVLFLLLMVFTFRHGIELTTITDTEKTPEQQTKLLDDYNSYSGNIASLFGTPVEKFVEAAVQVILLRFLTRAIMAAEPTWKLNVATGGVGMLAAYLISNGFTALNVQLRPRGIDAVISAADLSVAFNSSMPGLTTNTTHSFSETQPRNPITNTILRNAVLPRVLNREPYCQSLNGFSLPDVDVTFGFTQRDWQTRVLQEAPPVKQLRTSITDASNKTLLDGATSADMPMNASLAADLYLYGMFLMSNTFKMTKKNFLNATEITPRVQLTAWDGYDVLSIDGSDPALKDKSLAQVVGLLPLDSASEETAKRDHFLSTSLAGLRSQFKAAANASTSQINMTLSHVQISDGIAFDAITFQFEIDPMLMATASSKGNTTHYTEMRNEPCGPVPDRCFFKKVPFGSNDFQYDPPVQVQALRTCVNAAGTEELKGLLYSDVYPSSVECDQSSNTSMLVFSLGKRVAVDGLAVNNNSNPEWTKLDLGGGMTIATNLRKIFTVTVGKLSWQWRNLSSDFGASCDDQDFSSSCLGLQLPLANTSTSTANQTLVAGANTLAVSTLSPLRQSYLYNNQRLLPLALIREPSKGSERIEYYAGDLLLPHNIKSNSLLGLSMDPSTLSCDPDIEDRINSTLNNHLYNEHGLQPAYTAAVFFLFQNAVVRDIIPLNSTATTLDFAHNVRHLAVWLSVPDRSVWLTVAGCILLVMGLAAAMFEGMMLSETKSDSLTSITAPHVIARVMLDEGQFPPLLLHRHVVSSDDAKGGEMTHRRVEQFAIDSLGLKNQEDHDRLVAVV